MTTNMKYRTALLNLLCRICGQEDPKSISVFSESGKRQAIQKKIRKCLPLVVEETDSLPKQICLSCLHKLDATWELYSLCRDGQLTIAQKLEAVPAHSKSEDQEQTILINTIEDKVKILSETKTVMFGDTAIISLVPASPPPAKPNRPPEPTAPLPLAAPVGYIPTTAIQGAQVPTTTKADVYPEGLIQVNPSSKPVMYTQRNESTGAPRPGPRRNVPEPKRSVPAPRRGVPPPKPLPPIRRSMPSQQRSALREGGSINVPPPKRSLQMCKYCNKTFPDDIIDHHVNLHLRQSFSTCLDCNKNFRSEQAMSRHRCGVNDTINLESDDEPICL